MNTLVKLLIDHLLFVLLDVRSYEANNGKINHFSVTIDLAGSGFNSDWNHPATFAHY